MSSPDAVVSVDCVGSWSSLSNNICGNPLRFSTVVPRQHSSPGVKILFLLCSAQHSVAPVDCEPCPSLLQASRGQRWCAAFSSVSG